MSESLIDAPAQSVQGECWSGIPDGFNTERGLTIVGYALTAAADAASILRFGLFGFVATDLAVTPFAVALRPRQRSSIANLAQVLVQQRPEKIVINLSEEKRVRSKSCPQRT